MDTSALSRWIAEYALASDDWDVLLDGLCRALLEMGLPLWRVSIGARTLDPNMRAFNLEWHLGGAPFLDPDEHGSDREVAYQRSPIYALAQRGECSGRWRLDALREEDDFPLLHELRAKGGTDYLLRSCPWAWCSWLRATTITGLGRDDQAARVGRLTRGSSPIGAILSRVM